MIRLSIHLLSEDLRSYPMYIGARLEDVTSWLPQKQYSQMVIITDTHVKTLYGLNLQQTLIAKGYPATLLLDFPAGESAKNAMTKQVIEETMIQAHCDRDTLILALGGGVVGDLAGFIAATYLRGISYIQLPTTVLAMVDSSVGGKTGINTSFGKNLIGSIYHPKVVVADTQVLQTLSQKQKIQGLIEAIKMFLTHDAEHFFSTLQHLDDVLRGDETRWQQIIAAAVRIKAAVVARDEKEQGERSLLNLGHTIGHALEKISDYTLPHGEAVAYGLLLESTIAYHKGLLSFQDWQTIKTCLLRLGFDGKKLVSYAVQDIIQATRHDKKARQGITRYVLLQRIGVAYIQDGFFTHSVLDAEVDSAYGLIF